MYFIFRSCISGNYFVFDINMINYPAFLILTICLCVSIIYIHMISVKTIYNNIYVYKGNEIIDIVYYVPKIF